MQSNLTTSTLKIIFTLLQLLWIIYSDAQVITDKNIYAEPSPPVLPPAGGKFTDPVFGTEILRVTDSDINNYNYYSYALCHNINSTVLYIQSVNNIPTLYDFDPSAFTISNKRNAYTGSIPSGYMDSQAAGWSGIDPDLIYITIGSGIYQYNIQTNTYILIHDVQNDYTGAETVYLFQMQKSTNDSAFVYTIKDANNYDVLGYGTWHKKFGANVVVTSNVNEVAVDKTGSYYKVTSELLDPSYQILHVRFSDLKTDSLSYNDPPECAIGHSDLGTKIIVGSAGCIANGISRMDFNDPLNSIQLIDFANDWSQGNHTSMLSTNENWATISAYYSNTFQNYGFFKNEIFQIATDGSGNVRRLAHHHSKVGRINNTTYDYWSTPRAAISMDGKWITFTSNWGDTTRYDVFVLKVPDYPLGLESSILKYPRTLVTPTISSGIYYLSDDLKGDFSIVNTLGQTIKNNINTSNKVIDISDQPNGIYFVYFQSENDVHVSKISKQ